MFDTVSYRCHRPLHPGVLALLNERGGVYRGTPTSPVPWYLRVAPDLDRHDHPQTSLHGEGPAGILVRGHGDVVNWVQASLPRVLYSTNGRLLRTSQDVEDARAGLDALLDQISVPDIPLLDYTRVDLVLHFRGNPDRFVAGHRHMRHPLIRNQTTVYDGSGLVLPGRKVSLRMYDKNLEMKLGRGEVVRVEVELRKPKLAELFGLEDGQTLRRLDFWKAYEVYREFMLCMRPRGLSTRLDFNLLLAECEAKQFFLSNGLTPMETYRMQVDHKTYLHRCNRIKGLTMTVAGLDWGQLLPAGRLPDDLPDADY